MKRYVISDIAALVFCLTVCLAPDASTALVGLSAFWAGVTFESLKTLIAGTRKC
jgi:membrane protein implicated in regulation of membrane protease activity